MTMNVDAKELSAACDALGDIMLAIGSRKFAGIGNETMRAKIAERGLTDEQIGELAARAFERAALVLAEIGYPGATAFSCNPSEEP
jgi:hypothetical protein